LRNAALNYFKSQIILTEKAGRKMLVKSTPGLTKGVTRVLIGLTGLTVVAEK
jgi:hypothetical protein